MLLTCVHVFLSLLNLNFTLKTLFRPEFTIYILRFGLLSWLILVTFVFQCLQLFVYDIELLIPFVFFLFQPPLIFKRVELFLVIRIFFLVRAFIVLRKVPYFSIFRLHLFVVRDLRPVRGVFVFLYLFYSKKISKILFRFHEFF